MDIITDFSDIAKRANLKALEGRPQNDPHAIHKAPEPQVDYGFGCYLPSAGDGAVSGTITLADTWTELPAEFAPDVRGRVFCRHALEECSICHR